MEATQIHLEAVKQSEEIDELWSDLQNKKFDEKNEAKIALAIRFFGKNLAKLRECNEAMLKLGQSFLLLMDSVKWSLRDSNAFLLLITSMVLKRKEEIVIRQASRIMKEFVLRLPEGYLSNLVKFHAKATGMIFHKMSKVSTFYTQLKLLEVLNIILKAREDGGAKIIRQDKQIASCTREVSNEAVFFFDRIDETNFEDASRDFLDHYNVSVAKPLFIFTFMGYLMGLDEKKQTRMQNMFVDFNLRNLSISFFIKSSTLNNTNPSPNDKTYFVELEDCEFTFEERKFKDPNLVQLKLVPARYQILNEIEEQMQDLNFDSLLLAVRDIDSLLTSKVLPMIKEKTPMAIDNITDLDSHVSFRTVNSCFDNTKPVSKSQPIQEQPLKAKNSTDDLFLSNEYRGRANEVSFGTVFKQSIEPEKVRQMAKIEPTINKKLQKDEKTSSLVNFDNLPSEGEQLPPLSQFLVKKRIERQRSVALSQQVNTETTVPDNSEDVDWKPIGKSDVIKAPAKKRTPPKKKPSRSKAPKNNLSKTENRSKKIIELSSDIEDEILNQFGKALKPDKENFLKSSTVNEFANDQSYKEVKKIQILESQKEEPVKAIKPKGRQQTIRAQKSMTKAKEVNLSSEDDIVPKPQTRRRARKSKEAIKMPAVTIVDLSIPVPKLPQRLQQSKVSLCTAKETAEVPDASKQPDYVNKSIIEARRKAVFGAQIKQTEHKRKIKQQISVVNDENKPPAAKKRRLDFDNLLRKEPAKPISSLKNPVLTRVSLMARKRVSFDDTLEISKPASKTSSVSSVEVIPSSKQHQEEQPKVVFNYNALKNSEILEKFISDTVSNAQFSDEMDLDDVHKTYDVNVQDQKISENPEDWSEMVVTTSQMVQTRKMSPTIIRTVQIQEIQISPKQNDAVAIYKPEQEDSIVPQLKSRAQAFYEPLLKEIIELEDVDSLMTPEMKGKVSQAAGKARESNFALKKHVQEHVKLLKRLQHSKTKMMQLSKENQHNIIALEDVVAESMTELRHGYKDKVKKIQEIQKAAEKKEQNLKREVWQEYLGSVSNKIQNTLQSLYEF